jgi:peptide-methionine (S)-S-oxide reductase
MRFRAVLTSGFLMMVLGLSGVGAIAADAPSAGPLKLQTAIFAGGCFWCIESDFDHVPGVVETVSGYTGGVEKNPTYQQVARKQTGHREALKITYDPSVVSYRQLLTAFWHSVDPTDAGGQFCYRGTPYKTAVFVGDETQRKLAEETKANAASDLGVPVATTVEAASTFYPAEDYHQDYYLKNKLNYRFYRWQCGRNQRVAEVWGEKAYTGIPAHE